jgi:hypothetical protein
LVGGGPREITLTVGQSVRLHPGYTVLRFLGVAGDSRCPREVVCIWEGAGTAEFSLAVARKPAERFSMVMPGLTERAEDNTPVDVGGYRFQLLALDPYPVEGEAIPPSAYRATLRVSQP